MSSLGGSINLVDMPPEILSLILGFLYNSMKLWDFIESSALGPNITHKNLRDVDWEVRWRRIVTYGYFCSTSMFPPSWDRILRHMQQVVTTLKYDTSARKFVSRDFTLFIPEIPDFEDPLTLRQSLSIGNLLKDTVDLLAMMTQLASFSLVAKDDRIQQMIPQAFLYTNKPEFAVLLGSFPRLNYLSIGSSDLFENFDQNVFAAIVDQCPELEILEGLGSDALNESRRFVNSFKKNNRLHSSLRYLNLPLDYPVSWDDHDSDCIELAFEHLEIFPSLLELHIPISMERRNAQTTRDKWSDTAAIEKLKENATKFLRSQLERKKAMDRTEGKDDSELVALLVIENDAEPGVFVKEEIRL